MAGTAPATRGGAWSNHGMTHEARACMARYRQVHGATYDNLALLFLVSNKTAKKACDDITMYCLMMDPWHSAPTMLNRVLTGEQVKQLTLNTAPCTLYPEPCTMYLLPTPCTRACQFSQISRILSAILFFGVNMTTYDSQKVSAG